jgi:DMSO/TMAO reductase YedYZ molybdopterin-dependent catalytic subunit
MGLPRGQRVIGSFPQRYGLAFLAPPPPVVEPALIRVTGAVARPLEVPVSRLAEIQRRDLVADFHCVTGWSVPNLPWGGVGFRTFFESVIVPEAGPDPGVTHILFRGADGEHSTLLLEDALDEEVLLADRLNGVPLEAGHGAPLRLISPKQYAYKSTKYLCGIELHTSAPPHRHSNAVARLLGVFIKHHPRARVAQEERHRFLPAWAVRWIYRMFFRSWAWLYPRRSRP